MATSNSATAYGSVTKGFHWLTALLILTMFPLGIVADNLPYDTGAALALKAQVFTVHKTLGIVTFFVALARIVWTLGQRKPGLLNADKPAEAFLAEIIHWLLYASLVLVPLSGWLHHAATDGFAPIWWPFGQSLPLVPKSHAVAEFFAGWHWALALLLLIAVGLHVAGALKHHLIDRDATLRRMWFGAAVAQTPPAAAHATHRPLLVASLVYAAALGLGTVLGLSADPETAPAAAPLAAVQSDWQVQEGSLSITVKQLGNDLSGGFADWTAAITFDEQATGGRHGTADVTIAIGSLTLGSVTAQAKAPDFFDAEGFPTARFTADLQEGADGAYLADGNLTLKGVTVPVQMPFALAIDGDRAEMTGQTVLDRRDFNIGENHPDEGTVGFAVVVDVALTATRAGE
ncbi:cytochrome b/b6 domain-containing protein [Actibacterium sp. D379-3]